MVKDHYHYKVECLTCHRVITDCGCTCPKNTQFLVCDDCKAKEIGPSETQLKALVFDRVIQHLQNVTKSDPRRRERMRAGLALKNLRKCLDQVRREYDQPLSGQIGTLSGQNGTKNPLSGQIGTSCCVNHFEKDEGNSYSRGKNAIQKGSGETESEIQRAALRYDP